MSKVVFLPRVDAFGRRHRRLLVAANVALLTLVTFTLIVATDAPLVLYQAF